MNKEQVKAIKEAKKEITALAKKQDSIYEKTKRLLKTKDSGSWLFDYLYNEFGTITELDKRLDRKANDKTILG